MSLLLLISFAFALAIGCDSPEADPQSDEQMARARQRMVAEQMRARDITDKRVLDAMERVPRHLFVPE